MIYVIGINDVVHCGNCSCSSQYYNTNYDLHWGAEGMKSRERELFEAALRDVGLKRLRLDQVVGVYHMTFPVDALRADMRQRLHDAILELMQGGVVSVPDGDDLIHEDRLSLPQALEITNFESNPYFQ